VWQEAHPAGEVSGPIKNNERMQVIVQHVNVTLSVHCGSLGEEVETSFTHIYGETGPNYDAVQVFPCLLHILSSQTMVHLLIT
jgi:hypothetical protein